MSATAPRRRWAVLAVYMLVTLGIEVQWVAFAPMSRAVERFYAGQLTPGSILDVNLLAMLYLAVYLVGCVPASYVIDTYGIRVGVGAGATLAAAGGLVKGLLASSYLAVLGGQLLLAVAQPFVLNAATAVAARWFPLRERGLANGLAALAQYLGIAIAMVVGPLVVVGDTHSPRYGEGVATLLLAYGVVNAAAAVLGLFLVPERPAVPVEGPASNASGPEDERLGFAEGMRSLLANRDYRILLLLFLAGLGIFNALSSMVDEVAAHIGVSDSDGLIGACLLGGGIVGALVLPAASDALRKRRPLLVLCMGGMIPGVAGLTFAGALAGSAAGAYTVAKVAAGVLGFFVMSAGPIGFQYAAEIGRPAPESTSQGLLLLVGQASGIAFMIPLGSPRFVGPMLALFTTLTVGCFAGTLLLRESRVLAAAPARTGLEADS